MSKAFVSALLVTIAATTACTDGDVGQKQVHVVTQSDVAHHVEFGSTDFGVVPPNSETETLDVDNGPLMLRIDGADLREFELGSDNVSGVWTLGVVRVETQPGQFQLAYGITYDGE